MKLVAFTASALALLAAPALAVQPTNPGGFGQDRAAVIHGMQDGTSPYSTGAPGASEWGKIASERAGQNGAINNAYKIANGDVPAGVTPGTGNK
jgi:hypothetical protein